MPNTAADFDAFFSGNDDPWGFKSRWYESRKRALTLACLPAARYASAYEPGCANGELSAALAGRCEQLLVSDGAPKAVAAARVRLAPFANVRVSEAWLPGQWPEQSFDLIVISEIGFYLTVMHLDQLAARALASLRHGGTVLACHWRRPVENCALGGDEVQQRLGDGLALPQLSQLIEPDFRLDVWCRDARSVAQREGFA